MDVQRKKGILEVCVLAVLKKGPSYGYLIIRELEQCIEISESTLYPILKRLEQNGSLKTYRQEYNGRPRKYYQLTAEGQNKIDRFLDEWDELQTMYQFVAFQNQQEPEQEHEEAAGEEPEPEASEKPEQQSEQEGKTAAEKEPKISEKPEQQSEQEETAADKIKPEPEISEKPEHQPEQEETVADKIKPEPEISEKPEHQSEQEETAEARIKPEPEASENPEQQPQQSEYEPQPGVAETVSSEEGNER